jgi:hypothetical protein
MSPQIQIPETPLPSNYKKVANKVTMVIVAMPILLVTSWVLYERCELFISSPCVRFMWDMNGGMKRDT